MELAYNTDITLASPQNTKILTFHLYHKNVCHKTSCVTNLSDVKGKYFANLRVIQNYLRDADCDTNFGDAKGVPT